MSQFENSEIMLNYATLMEPKTAADVVDFAQELAVEVPVALAADLAIGAGVVAAPFVFGGAPAVAGAAVAGTSLLSLLGGPVGIIIGLSLAVGMAIWQVSKLTDDNVDDLVSRLEALDADTEGTQKFIDDWIANLKSFKPHLELAPTTTDPRKRVQLNKQKLDGMTKLYTYLTRMKADWPRLEARLTDWGADPGQARTAIDKTAIAMQQGLAQIKQQTRNSVQEFIATAGKEKQKSYPKIAKRIQEMWQELTSLHGAPPTFDSTGEKAGYDLAVSIIKGNVTVENFDKSFDNMVALHNLLEQGLKQSKQSTKAVTSGIKMNFSKRALTLGDGTMVSMIGPGVAGKTKPRRRRKSPVVKGLQMAINILNHAYNTGAGKIEVDGIYGPLTAGALAKVIASDLKLGKTVAQYAKVNVDTVQNVEMMRRRPDLIKAVYRVLHPIATKVGRSIIERRPRPISTREEAPTKIQETRGGKLVIPSDTTSLVGALKRQFLMKDRKTGETTSAYIWFRDMVGAGTEERPNVAVMIQLINAFIEEEQQGSRIWDPDKTPQELQKFVRERMGGREGEYRIF